MSGAYTCPHCAKPIGGWEVACPWCGKPMTPAVPPPAAQPGHQRRNPQTFGGSVTQGFGMSAGCLLFVVFVIFVLYYLGRNGS